MTKKICLVTGASSGIGKEVCVALAQSGIHVIMVCRNATKGQIALEEIKTHSRSTSIDLLIADLSSQKDIRLLAKIIHERYEKLNILINNAGVVLYKKELSVDGIEMTLATNHLGPFLLTHLLLDLLKKGTPSRIINVSSHAHKWANINLADLQFTHRQYQCMKVYAQSKLLVNLFTFALAVKLEEFEITVNCVHPGAVKTNIGTESVDRLSLKLLDRFIKFFCPHPQKAALQLCYLALNPEVGNITGKYFAKGKLRQPSCVSNDLNLSKVVWDVSEKLVNINHT